MFEICITEFISQPATRVTIRVGDSSGWWCIYAQTIFTRHFPLLQKINQHQQPSFLDSARAADDRPGRRSSETYLAPHWSICPARVSRFVMPPLLPVQCVNMQSGNDLPHKNHAHAAARVACRDHVVPGEVCVSATHTCDMLSTMFCLLLSAVVVSYGHRLTPDFIHLLIQSTTAMCAYLHMEAEQLLALGVGIFMLCPQANAPNMRLRESRLSD